MEDNNEEKTTEVQTNEPQNTNQNSKPSSEGNSSRNESKEAPKEGKKETFRKGLKRNLSEPSAKADKTVVTKPTSDKPTVSVPAPSVSASTATQMTPIAPPSDMNAEERQAFANPTPENAHIIQKYASRRSLETRADYSRQTGELTAQKAKIQNILSVVEPLENEYARKNIAIPDLIKRSIAWDKQMAITPEETALEWLEAYNVDLDRLVELRKGQPAQQIDTSKYISKDDLPKLFDERFREMQEEQNRMRLVQEGGVAIQSFMNSKPLFKDPGTAAQLEAEMEPFFKALRQSNPSGHIPEQLEKAYNAAVANNPVFSDLVSKLGARQELEKKTAEAEKAKAASKSITGGPGSGSPKIKDANFREGVRRHMQGG